MENQTINPNTSVTNEPPQIPVSPSINWSKIIPLVILVLILMGGSVFAGIQIGKSQSNKGKTGLDSSPTQALQTTTPITQPTELPNTQKIPTGWKVKIQNELQFYYPPYLENLINSKQFGVLVRSKQEIIAEYDEFRNSGGCPSTCGRFVEDPVLLQKQFTLLGNLNNQQNCSLSPSYEDDVKKDFLLFTGGIGNKVDISSQKTNQGNCMLRIIEADGFDVALQNYYYKAGFMSEDKVIEMTATIFPTKGFTKVEDLWRSFGYDFTANGCDANCYDKEVKYYENFSLNDPLVKEVTSTYDQILSTLSLTQ